MVFRREFYAAINTVLQAAFGLVKNRKHWKYAINATVRFKDAEQRAAILPWIDEAVPYFTGSLAEVYDAPSKRSPFAVRVHAPGYYAAIGA